MTPTPPERPHSPHGHPVPTLALYAALAVVLVGLTLPMAGSLLPEERTVSASARVDAPPPVVWNALARVANHPAWRSGVHRVEPLPGSASLRAGGRAPDRQRLSAGPGGAGTGTGALPEGWVEESRLGGRVRYRVQVAEPPVRLVLEVRQATPPYRGRRVLRLVPEDGGTRIVVGQRGGVENPLFRVAGRYLAADARDPAVFVRDLARRLARR